GSLFAIDTHTVTCEPEDSAGNPAIPVTFTITVLGAGEQIALLMQDVNGLGMPRVKQLTIQLFLLMAGMSADSTPGLSCKALASAAALVEDYTPRHISSTDAAGILASIGQIRTVLGC